MFFDSDCESYFSGDEDSTGSFTEEDRFDHRMDWYIYTEQYLSRIHRWVLVGVMKFGSYLHVYPRDKFVGFVRDNRYGSTATPADLKEYAEFMTHHGWGPMAEDLIQALDLAQSRV